MLDTYTKQKVTTIIVAQHELTCLGANLSSPTLRNSNLQPNVLISDGRLRQLDLRRPVHQFALLKDVGAVRVGQQVIGSRSSTCH